MVARFTPLEELVSCILSQHTADARSFPAFTGLMARYRTWDRIEAAPLEELVEVLRPAGMANQKARAIQGTLRQLRESFGEYTLEPLRNLPLLEARRWLETLPGVGPKTASIVLCFALGREAIPVDTHVHRLSLRMGLIPEGTDANKAHDVLLNIVPPDLAFRFHSVLIQHGRKICRAPIPTCTICPLASECPWNKKGGPERTRREMRKKRSAKKP